MKNFKKFNTKKISYLFTDIDDTLTEEGRLPACAYESLWKLFDRGVHVIPITGRPAGWCELIARMWPVAGVIGENGAFYFCYKEKKMKRHFVYPQEQIDTYREKLKIIEKEIMIKVPGAEVASDQFCRIFDLAIDFCEDVPPLEKKDVSQIVEVFKKHGATAKVSSIHVNGWFGDHDKLSMCKNFLTKEFNTNIDDVQQHSVFVGDSPNDEPMFGYFKQSFAVSNINTFVEDLNDKPKYVTDLPGGRGFTELIDHLLS